MFHLMFSYRKHFVRTLCVLTTSTNGRIFAISTFNTDYILTKKENSQNVLSVLQNAGCYFIRINRTEKNSQCIGDLCELLGLL